MRTEHLVQREQIDVRPKLRDIRQSVRGIRDTVHNSDRCRSVYACTDLRYRIDLTQDVRAVGKSDHCSACGEQTVQIVRVQGTGLRIDSPFADHDTVFDETAPYAAVSLVILIGHDDLVSGTKAFQYCLCEDVRILRR